MRTFVSRVKNKLKNIINPPESQESIFNRGYEVFAKTGQTPHEAYMAMVNLFCSTDGKFLEDFNQKIIAQHPAKKINEPVSGVLGNLNTADFTSINNTLNKDGYVNFNKKIAPELVQKLYNFALKTQTKTAPKYDVPVIYNPDQPTSEIYRFVLNDLVNNEDIQELIMDPTLINIARNYLGCEPIFDFPAMWWTTAYLKHASEEAAQLYHFDLDRIKWLKIFIYLTDVNEDNGPHRFIRGSHTPGHKPKDILKRGYARIPDEDLAPHYKPEDFTVYYGEAGAIFAGDTKCWHKGTPLKKGHRLVFELEYTSSLFGTNYPKLEITNASEAFKKFCAENKYYASNLHIIN